LLDTIDPALHSNVFGSIPLEKPGASPGGRVTVGELMPWRYKREATEDRLGALDLLFEALSTDKVSAVRMVPPLDPRPPSKTQLPITACWERSFRLPHQQNRDVVRTAGLLCRFDQA
jgi:hypothetical protein